MMRKARKKQKCVVVNPIAEIDVSELCGEEICLDELVRDPLDEAPTDENELLTSKLINKPNSSIHTNEITNESVRPSINEREQIVLSLVDAVSNSIDAKPADNDMKKRLRKEKKMSKKNRETGKDYLGYRRFGKTVKHDVGRSARQQGIPCSSKFCIKSAVRQCNLFSERDRLLIFDFFWKMNWTQKKLYVCNLIKTFPKKTSSSETSKRLVSRKHFLYKSDTSEYQVCKKMFLNTLGLKEKMVRNWLNSKLEFGMFEHPDDVREKIMNKRRQGETYKKNQERKDYLRQFLVMLPKLESHYCRKDTKKEYLQTEHRCYRAVYTDYLQFCLNDGYKSVSMTVFSKILKELNYALFKPRKDQCDDCVAHKAGNLSESEYQRHREEIAASKKEKENDLTNAMNKLCTLLSMDVQAVQLCPNLLASALYFSLKLQIHNFTIYDKVTHKSVNYVWDESEGELKASIFTSIIVKHIENLIENGCYVPIILYSDGCCYQNRNTILSSALSYLTVKYPITIYQKFLVKGHTQMECDSSHSLIERKTKKSEINLPSDFINAAKKARSNPFPLDVVNLTHEFFLNYDDPELCMYKSIRPGKTVGDPCVTNLRCIKYVDGKLFYKLTFKDEYKLLPHQPRVTQLYEPQPLYSSRNPISTNKFNDLQKLKYVLPQTAWSFYDSLPHQPNKRDKSEKPRQ